MYGGGGGTYYTSLIYFPGPGNNPNQPFFLLAWLWNYFQILVRKLLMCNNWDLKNIDNLSKLQQCYKHIFYIYIKIP